MERHKSYYSKEFAGNSIRSVCLISIYVLTYGGKKHNDESTEHRYFVSYSKRVKWFINRNSNVIDKMN